MPDVEIELPEEICEILEQKAKAKGMLITEYVSSLLPQLIPAGGKSRIH